MRSKYCLEVLILGVDMIDDWSRTEFAVLNCRIGFFTVIRFSVCSILVFV